MSLNSCPVATTVEKFVLPLGKSSAADLMMEYRTPDERPAPDEMELVFRMLDDLLRQAPLSQWEH